MLHHNSPIAVWHSQPFEVPVLDAGMRWALVRYRNPREQPRKFSLLKNLFVVRKGQSFGAVGNESCTSIRVWQFRWLIGWPKSKRIELAVRATRIALCGKDGEWRMANDECGRSESHATIVTCHLSLAIGQ
jgi:hypothetical protein